MAGVTHVADPTGAAEVVAGYGFFPFSAALGASIRYHANARIRDIEQAKLRQRNELARELHDAVGHHVSAIAIQAQAGRALAASHPDRALATLETIEEAASRMLEEMRAIVSVLREGTEPDFAPQARMADIQRLAHEAVTNAVRHARHATQVTVCVADEGEQVRLTVRDDGDAGTTDHTSPGFGLVGMTERVALLGGTLEAGPSPDRGWAVDAVLPKGGATA